MKRFLPLCALVMLAFAARPVRAEEQAPLAETELLERPRPAQGYYYSLGLQGGVVKVRDDDRSLSPLGGYAAALRIGQSVTTWMDLGLWLDVGLMKRSERSGSQLSFGVDWTLHPFGDTFVRLGGAVGVGKLSAAKHSDNTASSFGSVVSLTVGYAFFPFAEPGQSGGFSLSPIVRFNTLQPFHEDSVYSLTAGFEITRWSGLPRRQLDVPLDQAFPAKASPRAPR